MVSSIVKQTRDYQTKWLHLIHVQRNAPVVISSFWINRENA